MLTPAVTVAKDACRRLTDVLADMKTHVRETHNFPKEHQVNEFLQEMERLVNAQQHIIESLVPKE